MNTLAVKLSERNSQLNALNFLSKPLNSLGVLAELREQLNESVNVQEQWALELLRRELAAA